MHRPITRGVLFDLDDTLNDRAASWMAFVRLMMRPDHARLEPCVAEEVHRLILAADRGGYRDKGEFVTDLVRTLPWAELPTTEDVEVYWRTHFPACTVARAGAIDLLARLRNLGLKLGIVTNGRTATQTAKIHRLGLDRLVDVVIISEAVGIKKPEAAIFKTALAALGIDAAEAVFVGDDPERDVVGASAAGMRTAWLRHGRVWPGGWAAPDHTLSDLDEFETVVLDLNS